MNLLLSLLRNVYLHKFSSYAMVRGTFWSRMERVHGAAKGPERRHQYLKGLSMRKEKTRKKEDKRRER